MINPSTGTKIAQETWALMGAITRVGGDVDNSTVPRMVGEAEGVAVVNRR